MNTSRKHIRINPKNSSCPLVDRFIIIHLGLLPSGAGFDESSSVDELSEYVLYFFDVHESSSNDTTLDERNNNANNRESVIKFAGLCNALYSLSPICSSSDGEDDLTKEVHLSSCTLIFIPLEDSQINGLFAVAQCPRNQSNNNCEPKNEVNPDALRKKIQNAHELFKIIKFGGIHRRLMSFYLRNQASIGQHNCIIDKFISNYPEEGNYNMDIQNNCYPGMQNLYSCHKKLRKLVMELESNPNIRNNGLVNDINAAQNQIDYLHDALPINSIKRDLKTFYDWILSEAYSSNDINNLNIFEFLPQPQKIQFFDEEADKAYFKCLATVRRIESLVSRNKAECINSDNAVNNIIGFSAFQYSHHVHTYTETKTGITQSLSRLLFKYFSTNTLFDCVTEPDCEYKKYSKGCFVAPTHTNTSIDYDAELMGGVTVPGFGRICVHSISLENYIRTKAAVYRYGDASFMLFFVENDERQTATTAATLSYFAEVVDETMESSDIGSLILHPRFDFGDYSELFSQMEPGVQLLYANRQLDSCIFVPDDLINKKSKIKKTRKKKIFKIPFLDNGNKEGNSCQQEEMLQIISSQIPENVKPALVDMLTEANQHRHGSSISKNHPFESCSLMPNGKGWIFGLSWERGNKQLYVFFDSKQYYSFRDVLRKIDTLRSIFYD